MCEAKAVCAHGNWGIQFTRRKGKRGATTNQSELPNPIHGDGSYFKTSRNGGTVYGGSGKLHFRTGTEMKALQAGPHKNIAMSNAIFETTTCLQKIFPARYLKQLGGEKKGLGTEEIGKETERVG